MIFSGLVKACEVVLRGLRRCSEGLPAYFNSPGLCPALVLIGKSLSVSQDCHVVGVSFLALKEKEAGHSPEELECTSHPSEDLRQRFG